jgi:RNA polymerase-binding transcription factor DksA
MVAKKTTVTKKTAKKTAPTAGGAGAASGARKKAAPAAKRAAGASVARKTVPAAKRTASAARGAGAASGARAAPGAKKAAAAGPGAKKTAPTAGGAGAASGARKRAAPGAKRTASAAKRAAGASVARKTTVPGGKRPAVGAGRKKAAEAASPSAAGRAAAVEKGHDAAAVHRSARTAKKTPARKTGAIEKTGVTQVVAKETAGVSTGRAAPAAPADLAVRPGEDPWTPGEVDAARADLQAEADLLRAEIGASEAAITGLLRDSGDGAGDDQADTGTKNITREHEMALTANAREMLIQTEHALERLDAGTYGLCESCGQPIGKARTQAFPRATLCVECKQRQERR